MSEPLLVFSDSAFRRHHTGAGHPDQPARIEGLLTQLEECPVEGARLERPEPAPREALLAVHDEEYVALVESTSGRRGWLDPDTAFSEESASLARLGAGAAMAAVDHAWRGGRAFALVRPPGHHAERDRARGFCLLGNVAIAVSHALRVLGAERPLVIDWDVHHGNGTQHAFEEDPRVLFLDAHQHPLFPGSGLMHEVGRGAGVGTTLNAPLPAGFGDAEYRELFDALFLPRARAHRPDLVVVSAGFDAHAADPVGSQRVTTAGFAALCRRARELADEHASGRLALVLEGGYDIEALAASARACLEVLAGGEAPDPPGRADPALSVLIEQVERAQP